MRSLLIVAATVTMTLTGCREEAPVEVPPPFALTTDAIGRYCGMNVLEHAGPKGQVILAGPPEPIWFSSARDAVAFTRLPEEPKDISAIYVSDMAKAPNWDEPGTDNWVDARKAFYVIRSSAKGGMGDSETVPFSTQATADEFAKTNGGKVVSFDDIPSDYVLGMGDGAAAAPRGTETTD